MEQRQMELTSDTSQHKGEGKRTHKLCELARLEQEVDSEAENIARLQHHKEDLAKLIETGIKQKKREVVAAMSSRRSTAHTSCTKGESEGFLQELFQLPGMDRLHGKLKGCNTIQEVLSKAASKNKSKLISDVAGASMTAKSSKRIHPNR